MITKICLFLATLITGLMTSSFVMADNFYAAIDIGQTRAQDACNITGLPAGSTISGCKDSATAYRVAGGYKFAPMWGTEVSYGDYGSAAIGTATVPGVGAIAVGDWKLSGLQFSGIGTFPINDEFALTGKLGIARTDVKITGTSQSATSTKLAYGIGAQYSFTKSIAIRAQYEALGTVGDTNTTGTAKVKLLTAGILFMF